MRRWYYRLLPPSKSVVWVSILIVFSISFLALVGWMLDITLLKSVKPQFIRMSIVTAVCLILAAVELVLLQISPSRMRRFWVLQIPAMLVSLVGLLTFVLYFNALIEGKEPSLAGAPVLNLFWALETRLALLTAILFLISGCAMMLLSNGSRRTANIAHALMFPAAMVSYLVPISYLFGIQTLHGWLGVPVALNTGIAFCALSVAIFYVRPDTWLMRVLADDLAGSAMARRLLPGLLIVPLLIGWLHLYIEQSGAMVAEGNVALATVAFTFYLLCLVVLTAARLNREDSERQRAEKGLHQAHSELEQRVKERTEDLKQTAEHLQLEMEERLEAEAKLHESEARFRSAFDQSPVGAVIADLDFRFQRVNPAFCRIIGYTAEELSSMGVPDIVHPDDLPKGLEEMGRFTSGEIEGFRLEERNICRDGRVIWVNASATLIRDSGGRPMYYIGIIQDITARKQAEAAIRESEERLRLLSKQLITAQEKERQYIGLELHDDLGQLLMVLKMQLRAVQKNSSHESVGIRSELENILNFVNEIIERVRLLSRDLRPSVLEDIGLGAGLKLLFEDFRKYHGLKLVADMDNIENLFPGENRILIYRIFQESLTNVAKHAGATEVSVSLKKQNGEVAFQIQDNGKGFKFKEVLERTSSSRGLGLAAIDERVQMLGGKMNLWSKLGHGTRLQFTVPVENSKS